jgi:hypothetical protein
MFLCLLQVVTIRVHIQTFAILFIQALIKFKINHAHAYFCLKLSDIATLPVAVFLFVFGIVISSTFTQFFNSQFYQPRLQRDFQSLGPNQCDKLTRIRQERVGKKEEICNCDTHWTRDRARVWIPGWPFDETNICQNCNGHSSSDSDCCRAGRSGSLSRRRGAIWIWQLFDKLPM